MSINIILCQVLTFALVFHDSFAFNCDRLSRAPESRFELSKRFGKSDDYCYRFANANNKDLIEPHTVPSSSLSSLSPPSILTRSSSSRKNFISYASKLVIPLTVALPPSIQSARAISPEKAASSYDKYASSYDALDGGQFASALGIDQARAKLLSKAKGDVIEIGVGTGLNIPYYPFSNNQITSITFVDVSEGMLQQSKNKANSIIPKNVRVNFVKADATSQLVDLFGKCAFDTVLDTFSLCVMGNKGADACLQQMGNIVKKESDGGAVLLLENSRSQNALLGWYQDITAETAAFAGGKGCIYNQDVIKMITNNELLIRESEEFGGGVFRSVICVAT